VVELLLDLHRHGRTMLVMVTHSAELAALLPRQTEMVDGRLKSSE
jgi:predicted ABC-type transport system involved in lysophospholipase L1 biosynthesis ATPase subunit